MDLREPGSYFFPASGGLGWGLPASMGIALADPDRPVVAIIGDGSAHYSIAALRTAVDEGIELTIVVRATVRTRHWTGSQACSASTRHRDSTSARSTSSRSPAATE